MKAILLIGRILFSFIFINAVMVHFSQRGIDYASSKGVPAATLLVPIAGVLSVLGGLSVLFGYKTKAGAWLLIVFLVPVTLWMHAFWNETEPMQQQMQMANFMKNIALLGGALILTYFGSGPLSIDSIRTEEYLEKPEMKREDRTIKEEIKQKEKVQKAPAETQEFLKEFCPFFRKSFRMQTGENLFV
jgi:putative oxidoreductase